MKSIVNHLMLRWAQLLIKKEYKEEKTGQA